MQKFTTGLHIFKSFGIELWLIFKSRLSCIFSCMAANIIMLSGRAIEMCKMETHFI